MIDRRVLLAAGLDAVWLAGCGRRAEGVAAPGEVRFSILSTEAAQNVTPYWGPILADMQKQTGLRVTPFFSSNYTLLVEAMRFKQTDLGWFSNLSGLEAVRQANGQVFARAFDAGDHDGYASVLIVPLKSRITLDQVLKCGRRLTLGMGDALSTSGTLAPMTYLFAPRGIDPAICFKQVRRGASHQANLYAVANGQIDVATNNTASLLLARRRGRVEASEVRVIWQSSVLPEDPLIWRKDLDPAVKERLRQFFLTYGQGDTPKAALQRSYLARFNVGGFRPADDSHLLPVREMEAAERWLAAKQSGGSTKAAAAKKTLDSIRAERMALEARTRAPAAAQ
ncbi:MAG TPA: phosphate/phosphite/phosphonate ABC transporter substrate-binding protein [Caulobacteraceae bacterium]